MPKNRENCRTDRNKGIAEVKDMLIGLHDAERDHMKHKTFPNFALMKVSAWHKARGDTVEWWNGLINARYDKIYSSKVFDFTLENPYLPEMTIKGGTGYGTYKELPPEVDAMRPDYSIYPEFGHDKAIGFITRGCPNSCPWCVVPEKEGDIRPYRRWRNVVREYSDKLILMDNNILASDFGVSELEGLIGSGHAVDLNQGMDARLVTPEIADIIARLTWIRHIRFSCDTQAQIEPIMSAAALLARRGVKPYRLFVYILVTKDIDDAALRVDALKSLKDISLYAQAERNDGKGIMPNAAQLEFSQRYVYGKSYRRESWEEYRKYRRLNFKE
jgi:hypothetical protein